MARAPTDNIGSTSSMFRSVRHPALYRLAGALLFAATALHAAPQYTAAGIVHAATQLSQTLAPNTIATLYGANLAYATHAVTGADLLNGTLPTTLEGVTVYVNNQLAHLYYVSPGQINFLIPYVITTATATVFVINNGAAGPTVTIPLAGASPAFFQWNGNLAVAVHASGVLISPSAPATGGEIIILFAAGLGRSNPDTTDGEIAVRATPILSLSQFHVILSGTALPAANILYAGLAPGFSGLYQINLRLPDAVPVNPVIQLAIGGQVSPAAVVLPVQ